MFIHRFLRTSESDVLLAATGVTSSCDGEAAAPATLDIPALPRPHGSCDDEVVPKVPGACGEESVSLPTTFSADVAPPPCGDKVDAPMTLGALPASPGHLVPNPDTDDCLRPNALEVSAFGGLATPPASPTISQESPLRGAPSTPTRGKNLPEDYPDADDDMKLTDVLETNCTPRGSSTPPRVTCPASASRQLAEPDGDDTVVSSKAYAAARSSLMVHGLSFYKFRARHGWKPKTGQSL
jgi:hypothetical protein